MLQPFWVHKDARNHVIDARRAASRTVTTDAREYAKQERRPPTSTHVIDDHLFGAKYFPGKIKSGDPSSAFAQPPRGLHLTQGPPVRLPTLTHPNSP
jgi:hypothetical protein